MRDAAGLPAVTARRWRSELAIPGSNQRMIEKGIASTADVVFLDLEDAVAPSAKATARPQVAAALRDGAWGSKPRAFRVNALDTPHFYRDLIDVVEGSDGAVELVVVPKVDRPEDVHVVATLLTQLELALGLRHRIGIEAQIETAAGLVNSEAIARASDRLKALTFGPGDFAASAGMPAAQIGMPDHWDAAYPGHRWGYALSRIAIAAKAAGLRAIDGPYADFRDPEGLRRSARAARALGYDGKWCIHPDQVTVVNDVFTPSADEIAHARAVVAAYEAARADGRGSVALDGHMIDGANLRMARRALDAVHEDDDGGGSASPADDAGPGKRSS